MNRELYIETIKKECFFLEQEGYVFNQLENNIYYTKESQTEGYRIGFSWVEYGHKFATQGLSAKKRFNIVEQEIQKILGGELTDYYTIHITPSVEYIPKGLEFIGLEKNIRCETNTVNDIVVFTEFLSRFYSSDVIYFFSNYKDFMSVVKSYEKLGREKISSLILNTGTDIFYRELVIKNKSGSKDERDFAKLVIDELEPLKSNSTFRRILENFKILLKNLNVEN